MVDREHRVVVGIDGSAGSRSALRWALAQARLTGAKVEAVAAWQDPYLYGYGYGWPASQLDVAEIAAVVEKSLAATLTEVVGEHGRGVEVTGQVVEGSAAQVLVSRGATAQLLVVGKRGHGAFVGMLLGSVSQHCVQNASCPVAVIPEEH
jgi:nucleotide-binding universal stress UspA family protein